MKPLDTATLGPIKIEPSKQPHDRASLLEYVNKLNMHAEPGVTYWTCTVLYNTVIWRRDAANHVTYHDTIRGVLK